MGWETIIYWVISAVISAMLAPTPKRPADAKAATFDEFQVPSASEAANIPVVFGSRWISQPNVVWYGDFDQEAIMSKGGGGKK